MLVPLLSLPSLSDIVVVTVSPAALESLSPLASNLATLCLISKSKLWPLACLMAKWANDLAVKVVASGPVCGRVVVVMSPTTGGGRLVCSVVSRNFIAFSNSFPIDFCSAAAVAIVVAVAVAVAVAAGMPQVGRPLQQSVPNCF